MADDRVDLGHRVLEDLRAQAPCAALGELPRQRGPGRRDPALARHRLECRPLGDRGDHDGEEDEVEELSRARDLRGDRKVASTTGTAPRRPAQPSMPRSREEKCDPRVAAIAASGRARRRHDPEHEAVDHDEPQLGRGDEQAERQEQAELRDPGGALVEGPDRLPRRDRGRPEQQPGEVDREEARAAASRRRRSSARPPPARRPGRARRSQAGAAKALDRRAATTSTRRARLRAAARAAAHVVEAPAGVGDPADQPEHEQHGDGVVEAPLALERRASRRRSDVPRSSAKIAAPSVEASTAPSSSPSRRSK